jgi:hypothetical protein
MHTAIETKKRLLRTIGYPEWGSLVERRLQVMFLEGGGNTFYKGTITQVLNHGVKVDFDDGTGETYDWKELNEMMDKDEIKAVHG